MNNIKNSHSAFRSAFPHTIPVMAGYIFLGITYGILMRTSGFPWWYPTLTALIVYTGSMEFLLVSMLLSAFHPLSVFVTAIMVGARHLFYGISLLKTYRNVGCKKFYLIYTTSDETFSVIYTTPVPDSIDRGSFYFWISFLDQMYWTLGTTLGGLLGGLITFDVEGLDFVMTAMFVVILMNQWMKDGTRMKTLIKDHIPELIGILGSVVSLIIFGADHFIIPAMMLILALLMSFRRFLDPSSAPDELQEPETHTDTSDTSTDTSKTSIETSGTSTIISKTGVVTSKTSIDTKEERHD